MNTKKVIILEDEIIIARHIELVLMEAGYLTKRTSTLNDFKEYVEANSPDLAIIDIHLRNQYDGIEAGSWLHQKDIIPFIYLTSYTDEYTINKAIQTNPRSYLVKPFKEKELVSNVMLAIKNHIYKDLETPNLKHRDISEIPFKLKRTIRYINENIDDKISLKQLAEITGWSIPHFNKNFKDYLKVSPYQFILERKIEKAKEMILFSNTPIKVISLSLGFSSHSNFSKAFYKFYGMSANKFRKMNNIKSYVNHF